MVASTELSDDPWVSDAPAAVEIVGGNVFLVTPSDRELLVAGGRSSSASPSADDLPGR